MGELTCYCHDPDHDLCYDGLIGLFDYECSCCRETARAIAEFPNG